MNFERYFFGIILLFVVILIGCAQQQTKYVCPDGSTVSDTSYCPEEEINCQVSVDGKLCTDKLGQHKLERPLICQNDRYVIRISEFECFDNHCNEPMQNTEEVIRDCGAVGKCKSNYPQDAYCVI